MGRTFIGTTQTNAGTHRKRNVKREDPHLKLLGRGQEPEDIGHAKKVKLRVKHSQKRKSSVLREPKKNFQPNLQGGGGRGVSPAHWGKFVKDSVATNKMA